jgi:hypothetical protein
MVGISQETSRNIIVKRNEALRRTVRREGRLEVKQKT